MTDPKDSDEHRFGRREAPGLPHILPPTAGQGIPPTPAHAPDASTAPLSPAANPDYYEEGGPAPFGHAASTGALGTPQRPTEDRGREEYPKDRDGLVHGTQADPAPPTGNDEIQPGDAVEAFGRRS